LLTQNGIPFCTVTFHQSSTGDACGSAADHANELGQIVKEVKSIRGQQHQLNIVSHSKGGLDARKYVAQSGTRDLAKFNNDWNTKRLEIPWQAQGIHVLLLYWIL
jgi:triacylglycerol esterase/lipase EstA (alpha/beta hydrolase family)